MKKLDINLEYAETIMTDEQRMAYDKFINALTDFVLKYGPIVTVEKAKKNSTHKKAV
ncbi:hypothetical protein [Petroclostridium sp. X23]|uniref:hypothetical protein n=1 Tax=Petroclostridium sp. X23 TaxID=3045146 RepID=UPI0024ACFF5A|nr:hypothetical protein [Petroclostridium sp. X23]WHH59120.1 hypothetical protein QKW49_25600 [Petroclostridium sp. X23]